MTALAAETGTASGPGMSCRSEFGLVIAVLSGELEISCAPVLREQLLGVLRPAASRLVIDLSGVSYADASGLAVLVGTGRRAGLLGGFLRLAAPVPAVADVLRITGLSRHLDIYPTVAAAISSPLRQSSQAGASWTGASSRGAGMSGASWRGAGTTGPGNRPAVATLVPSQPPAGQAGRLLEPAEAGELRRAIAAVLQHADAWRDADPRRQFAPALQALARAYAAPGQTALTQAARALLSIVTSHPLTHSPAVAATASRLRRVLDSARLPALS